MSRILVTGGCGYIGSHTLVDLIDNGHEVVSVDNGINSDFSALDGVEKITGVRVTNYNIDLCDLDKTQRVFKKERIDGIIHFAALKAVGESVDQPGRYFRNNLNSLTNILDCAVQNDVEYFVFSSSCTVYGDCKDLPVTESSPLQEATSPYGLTKQLGEKLVERIARYTNISTVLLRYFNPAGAHHSSMIGESPVNPPLNLVPIITETAIGKRKAMTVYGTDYDTRDGSCIRDYIHVEDLAHAHTLALDWLAKNDKDCEIFNLGIGDGVSVLEAIEAFELESGEKLEYRLGERREGDVPAIYADYGKAKNELNWNPTRGIKEIMKSAWEWERRRSANKC